MEMEAVVEVMVAVAAVAAVARTVVTVVAEVGGVDDATVEKRTRSSGRKRRTAA